MCSKPGGSSRNGTDRALRRTPPPSREDVHGAAAACGAAARQTTQSTPPPVLFGECVCLFGNTEARTRSQCQKRFTFIFANLTHPVVQVAMHFEMLSRFERDAIVDGLTDIIAGLKHRSHPTWRF